MAGSSPPTTTHITLTPPTARIAPTPPTTLGLSPLGEAIVSFDCATQDADALHEAAYRMIGTASCQIERVSDRFECHLCWPDDKPGAVDAVKMRFIDLVTDENLRAKLTRQTEPTRNLILALAFGAIAASEPKSVE